MRYQNKLLFFAMLMLIPVISIASSIKQLDIRELLQQSELVFQGQVIAQEVKWNSNKTDIYTDVSFRIDDVIVGEYASSTLSLRFIGGTIDQANVTVEGSKIPSLEESGVYFVSSTTQFLVNPIVGWAQGHFLTQRDDSGVMRMMTQNLSPIVGIDMQQTKTKFISDGIATGINENKSAAMSEAMSVEEFKSQLKTRQQN